MKIAHLADLHLGFRQFSRLTSRGVNQREADVAQVFRRALDAVIEAAPDLIVLAGDLFHSVRPTNAAILDSFNQLRRVRTALPETPVVIVAGNHDTPRSAETGTILRLFEALDGVHVVAFQPRRLHFERLRTSVLCVPNIAWSVAPRPDIAPDPDAAWNLLVTHREVEGAVPRPAGAVEYGPMPIRQRDLHADQFDYVALGHYHVVTKIERNVWYAGALEYVTTNPWGESRERGGADAAGSKGWLLVELGKRLRVRFQPMDRARGVVDLEPIQGAGLGAAELNRAIGDAVAAVPGGIDGQIVRQVVYDVPRITARDLDHAAIRGLKARALHFRLDLRRPTSPREVGVGAPGSRQALPDLVIDYLKHRRLPADVSRDALVSLGTRYLQAVDAHEAEP